MARSLDAHKVVSENDWIDARKLLLKKEKEFTIMRDQLNRLRQELPWKPVTKQYLF